MEEKKEKTVKNDNTFIYEKLRDVPQEARTPIKEGRLAGKTSINSMWRIKKLTELFGPCGIGWNFRVTDTRKEQSPDGVTTALFVDILFRFKDPQTGQWSEEIHGTGGNVLVRRESKGPYMNDDAYKMAVTDAISSAAKLLGLGADVHFENDVESKYTEQQTQTVPATQTTSRQAAYTGENAPARQEDQKKPELTKLHPKWSYSIATIAASQDPSETIRKKIEKMYRITDNNFNELLKLAGRQPSNS